MGEEKALAVRDSALPMEALSTAQVVAQVQQIQEIMAKVMRDGEHYGKIPGTDKPTLLKAGAEKLGFTFRLIPRFDVKRTDLSGGHREYEILCTLVALGSGETAGQGVGVCSTMESKYRWRKQSVESEVGPVPPGYWDIDRNDFKARGEFLAKTYGPGKYRPKKVDGMWIVMKVEGDGEKIENPDIADTYNTVLKMAKKRAHVDAIITATAASDIFAQDLEEMVEAPKAKSVDRRPAIEKIAEAVKAKGLSEEVRKVLRARVEKARSEADFEEILRDILDMQAPEPDDHADEVAAAAEAGWEEGKPA